MGLEEEIFETEFGKQKVESFEVSAFRKPESTRLAPERFLERTDRNAQLQADGLHIGLVRRQEGMRPHAGQKRKFAAILQALQHGNNFANAIVLPAIYQRNLATVIEIHHRSEILVSVGAVPLSLDEIQLSTQMLRKLFKEQGIGHHRKQRRRHAQVESPRHALLLQAPEHLHQRQVGFRHSLEEPVLFQEPVIVGFAHKRQVRMQQQMYFAGRGQSTLPVQSSRLAYSVRLTTMGTIVVGKSPSLSVANTGMIFVESGRSSSKLKVPSGFSGKGSPRTCKWASGRVPP